MLKITARQIVAGVGTGLLAGTLVAALELDVQGQICEYNQATEHEDCTTYSLFPFLLIQVFNTLNYYGVAITALATVAIGVFTLTLKLSTDRLWEAGEKQRRLYEETAERQLRAYVFGNGGSISLIAPPEGDMQLHVDYRFKNFGQTPAYKASMWTTLEIFDVNAPVISQHTGLGNFVIGPGANSESKLGRQISVQNLLIFELRRKQFLFGGKSNMSTPLVRIGISDFTIEMAPKFLARVGPLSIAINPTKQIKVPACRRHLRHEPDHPSSSGTSLKLGLNLYGKPTPPDRSVGRVPAASAPVVSTTA